ncbi:hypothetical protein KAU11_04005 [Candidatus Babeliales bacterium]|nr:hypothetical protein [Candidatus Babeliales bacterium]
MKKLLLTIMVLATAGMGLSSQGKKKKSLNQIKGHQALTSNQSQELNTMLTIKEALTIAARNTRRAKRLGLTTKEIANRQTIQTHLNNGADPEKILTGLRKWQQTIEIVKRAIKFQQEHPKQPVNPAFHEKLRAYGCTETQIKKYKARKY